MRWGVSAAALPLALGVAWATLRAPAPVPGLGRPAASACQPGRAVADQVSWRPSPAGSEADFWSSGLLRLDVCGPGTLRFTASGTPALGQDARLTVALGVRPLLETTVRRPRTFRLRVSGPGWLSFGFPNDAYRPPEDRNLFLRALTFTPD